MDKTKERTRCEVWTRCNIVPSGYEVSNFGRIRNKKLKILKSVGRNSCGYQRIAIRNRPNFKRYLIHRLVAQAFIPNPENKLQVNHINGNKTDNRLENLEWVTRSENMKHALLSGLFKPNTSGMINYNKINGVWNKGLHTGNQYA